MVTDKPEKLVTLTFDVPFQMREDLRLLAVKKHKKIKELGQRAITNLLKEEVRRGRVKSMPTNYFSDEARKK